MAIERRRPEMSMMRPFEEMERFMDRAFRDFPSFRPFWYRAPRGEMSWMPAIDIYEQEKQFIVRAELPGVNMDDVDIAISGDMLTIKGERKMPQMKDEEYQMSEITYGTFSRTISLPQQVQADKIEATMESGILEIKLPKVPEAVPTRIQIKSGKSQ